MTAALNDTASRGSIVLKRPLRGPVVFGIVSIALLLLPLLAPRAGSATFRLTAGTEALALPDVVIPGDATTWICGLCLAIITAASSARAIRRNAKSPVWMSILFIVIGLIGFLAWACAGKTLPVAGLLGGALALATPLVFGALGGVVGERAGVVNIAIEAQLLAGAFCASITATITATPWAGLVASVLAGMLVALVLGVFAISYHIDQVIVGVVLNVLVIGLTTFLFRQVLNPQREMFNAPRPFDVVPIPFLSEIPILGPVLFRQTIVVYLMFMTVVLVWYGMYRTRWGLRLRAVGEHPQAADTVGIDVSRTRYRNLVIAGAITGAGGAFFTLVAVPSFNPEMTAGAGFIALAAVIFGKWHPLKATLAALLFGFASSLQSTLSVIGSPVPSQFMLMLPYVVTIFAVAGLVGRSRAPAADGVPYVKS